MVTELQLAKIKTYGTLSGYIYLHLPQYLCRQFGISSATHFVAIYRDGELILKHIKEDKDAV